MARPTRTTTTTNSSRRTDLPTGGCEVDGLVARPIKLSLDDLRALPSRTQITRHDCVEGWSCIGKWKGVPLSDVIRQAEPQPSARYAVFHCADPMESGNPNSKYYESIDLMDAVHPQTILAYDMNDKAFRSPMALRSACGSNASSATRWPNTSCASSWSKATPISVKGKGGYWEDQGYTWYAGI